MDYDKVIPEKISSLKPSGIRKFFDIVSTMKDTVSLTIGEPDFVTPWHIRAAGIESLEKGKTYYTSNSGLADLREAIADYLGRRFSLSYDPGSEIVVTVGGSEAIDITMRSLVAPGDEVIIPEPAFVCYEPICRLCGGEPVIINTREEDRFKLTADALRAAITPKTKLLVLPFPNNPTGAIMEKADLEAIAEVLRGTDIMVLSDEIYAELTYGQDHVSAASIDGMRERTVLASGFSKAFAMTGWRLGYIAAPRQIAKQLLKIHQYALMCAPTASQFAAIEAMRAGDGDVETMRAEYNRRRRFIVGGLQTMGIDCFMPQGTFYVFPNISKFGMGSDEFCERLLRENKVAIVPGGAFGESGEGFARISYAYSVEHIAVALDRIDSFIKKL
ncbi:MAG: aminotransferase class I/II-fold pyridoxal phosphate-dependent enzyme [Clostridia bacterium]|nr:aminotransferase class I/II-fold pyridoxal phosphate-dependent enzyme [Clostridia bacterium]MBQ6677785.1 aminotransferase class I/II-fold pyridoxal phosphate-dependent enzyme [Clostridia bacterium]